MANFKQKIYFLALQKYLSVSELMSYLNLKKEDLLSITTSYGRVYTENQETLIEAIVIKKLFMMIELLRFIFDTPSEDFKVTLRSISETFNISEPEFINFAYYIARKYPKLNFIFFSNEGLRNEIKEAMQENVLHRINQKGYETAKLFRGNAKNTERLIKLAKETSIEELALTFSTSPFIVEEELVYLGLGGYWNNENIRTNGPIFFDNLKNRYSKSELIYLINNLNKLSREEMAKRLKTTEKNLKDAIEIIKAITYDKETAINLLKSNEEHIINDWILIKRLCSLKKENKEYLYKFNIKDLFGKAELNVIESFRDELDTKMDRLAMAVLDFKNSHYLFVLSSGEAITGSIESEINGTYIILVNENKKTKKVFINKCDIILFKKIAI